MLNLASDEQSFFYSVRVQNVIKTTYAAKMWNNWKIIRIKYWTELKKKYTKKDFLCAYSFESYISEN